MLHDGILEGRKAFGNVMKYLLMGTSSNFGNMFSMAARVAIPAVPADAADADPAQQLPLRPRPGHHPDRQCRRERSSRKPRRWNISMIRDFMLFIGPISSIYDFLTFFVLLLGVPGARAAVPHGLVRRVAGHANAGAVRDPHSGQPFPLKAQPAIGYYYADGGTGGYNPAFFAGGELSGVCAFAARFLPVSEPVDRDIPAGGAGGEAQAHAAMAGGVGRARSFKVCLFAYNRLTQSCRRSK